MYVQLTEFEHEPATLGERCTVTRAIEFCLSLLLFLLQRVRIQGLRCGLCWPFSFAYPLLRFVGLMCVCVNVCMLSQVLGRKFTNAFSFCRRRFLSQLFLHSALCLL